MTRACAPKTKPSSQDIYFNLSPQKEQRAPSSEIRLQKEPARASFLSKEKRLNEIERKALDGMIAYVAYMQKLNRAFVTALLASKFNVEEPAHIPSRSYDDAMAFLFDFEQSRSVH